MPWSYNLPAVNLRPLAAHAMVLRGMVGRSSSLKRVSDVRRMTRR